MTDENENEELNFFRVSSLKAESISAMALCNLNVLSETQKTFFALAESALNLVAVGSVKGEIHSVLISEYGDLSKFFFLSSN